MKPILEAFFNLRKSLLNNNFDPENFTFVIKDRDGLFRFTLKQEIPVVGYETDKLMGFKITFIDKD